MTTASRSTHRLRPIHFVLSLLLALGGIVGVSAPAYAAGGVMSGKLVDQVGAVVEGVDIEIWDFVNGIVETVTSDSSGDFATSVLPDSPNYYLFIPPNSTDIGGLEVGQLQVLFGISSANQPLGNVMVKRAVPVSGTITNWTPAMGNVRVQVYKPVGASWQYETDALSTGATFSVPAILDNGDYSLYFILDTTSTAPFVDAYLGGEYFDVDVADKFTTTAGTPESGITMAMPPAALITGTVTDKATGLPIDDVYVAAESETGGYYYSEYTTGPDGTYVLRVVPGLTYSVYAEDNPGVYRAMVYDDLDPCGCTFTPVDPTLALAATGIDFALVEDAAAVFIVGYLGDGSAGPGNPFDNVRVHLYKPVAGGWTEVDVAQSDSNGEFELLFPAFGSYRLRFEHAGLWLPAIDGAASDGAGMNPQSISGCFVDTGALDASSVSAPFAFVVFAGLNATGGCGPEPVPASGGSGTQTTRGHAIKRAGFSNVGTLVTPTPTPSATPTSTPSPSPSASSEPSPSVTPTPDPIPTQNPLDLWWLWLLLFLIVALIIFFIVRAILRR